MISAFDNCIRLKIIDHDTLYIKIIVEGSTLLVEEVVIDFDLGIGLEVIWKQHHRDWNMAQVINLQTMDIQTVSSAHANTHQRVLYIDKHTHRRTYRIVDSPHKHAQHGIACSKHLNFLLHKMFLLCLTSANQNTQRIRSVTERSHRTLGLRKVSLLYFQSTETETLE